MGAFVLSRSACLGVINDHVDNIHCFSGLCQHIPATNTPTHTNTHTHTHTHTHRARSANQLEKCTGHPQREAQQRNAPKISVFPVFRSPHGSASLQLVTCFHIRNFFCVGTQVSGEQSWSASQVLRVCLEAGEI